MFEESINLWNHLPCRNMLILEFRKLVCFEPALWQSS